MQTVTNEFNHTVKTCDVGLQDDPLWVLRDSMGIVGVVRASSWEEAWEACEDELFPEADQTWEEIAKDCECDPEKLIDDACFQEAYGFRPNGPNASDKLNHGLYAKDLNGEQLEKLTYGLANRLRLNVTVDASEHS